MHHERKLWIIKFCMKVVYPKFNFYLFCTFLAVKYRISMKMKKAENFEVKTITQRGQRHLLKDQLDNRTAVLLHKCLVISQDQFLQLACDNLFFMDNGLLWIRLELSKDSKNEILQEQERNKNTSKKYNLNFITSEFHKKLWTGDCKKCLNEARIIPVIGSKHVKSNAVVTTEEELSNIMSAFNVTRNKDFRISFHPVPSFEFAPKIASKAEVSLVQNEFDVSNDFVKEILGNHFLMPKLMHRNDIFYIDLRPEITGKQHYRYIDLVESVGRLYFRCQKINSQETDNDNHDDDKSVQQPYFIVKGVTQLSLGENIHLLKPQDQYINANNYTNGVLGHQSLKSCPTGLEEKFLQMQDTISTFLSDDLSDLGSSLTSPIIPLLLLTGALGSARHLIIKLLAKYNGMNCLNIDCNALQSSTAKQTESKISSTIQKAKAAAPAIVLLDNFEVFGVDAENNEDCRVIEYFNKSLTELYQNYTKHKIIFIAVTEKSDLKPNILRIFLEKFHIPKLNSKQRFEILQWFASVMNLNICDSNNEKCELEINCDEQDNYDEQVNYDKQVDKRNKEVMQRLAAKTETFVYGDLDTLMHFALKESYLKKRNKEVGTEHDMSVLQEEDFNSALESMRSLQSQHLDAPKIPKVYWEDIGGLDKLKKELLKTIEFPIKYPHLFKNSALKRSGILLYGPPGCGKTLVAKAVSTELNVSFLSVKGPELLNMYIGQSEENVRKVFESGRASSPCIIFLDELDALAPRRGAAGDSGGAADRLVSQLLADLDGVTSLPDGSDSSSFVFVMGATNRPDLLEQSLLRPGRLDKMIYVGPYCGLREKQSVMRALCRSHKLSPCVDIEAACAALPERVTGADLLGVVSSARSAAVRATLARLQAGEVKESELSADSVVITAEDMWEGVRGFRPSVTHEEMAYYESLQNQF